MLQQGPQHAFSIPAVDNSNAEVTATGRCPPCYHPVTPSSSPCPIDLGSGAPQLQQHLAVAAKGADLLAGSALHHYSTSVVHGAT